MGDPRPRPGGCRGAQPPGECERIAFAPRLAVVLGVALRSAGAEGHLFRVDGEGHLVTGTK